MISSTNPTAEYTEMHELVLTTSRIQENAKDTSKALWKDDENKKGSSARVETCFRTSHYLSRGKGGGGRGSENFGRVITKSTWSFQKTL